MKKSTANLGQPVKNKNKVPQKLWRKFSNHAKKVFNDVYYSMRPSMQAMLKHPGALIDTKEHWETIRWNASVVAAWAADGVGRIDAVKDVKVRKKRHVK